MGNGKPGKGRALPVAGDADGFWAEAGDYAGLVHAWQTLKQIRRHPGPVPCFTIEDEPDLALRVYHLDLKGTRRRLDNLHAILPRLAELKINAVLAEYEDYVRLDACPDLAIPDALSKDDVRQWIDAAAVYGIRVIPLMQTVGHWQYILRHPRYAHLAENADDPCEGCTSLPGTWELARGMLDEIMALHPDAPYVHVGLDETFQIGTCSRCVERLAGRPRHDLYVEWFNRVVEHVNAMGRTPMGWGDMAADALSDDQLARLDRRVTVVDWGYEHTGPLHHSAWFKGRRMSREWQRRPNAEINSLPLVGFKPGAPFVEDLSAEDLRALKAFGDNPEFPCRIKIGFGAKRLRDKGFEVLAVSGVRVSFHGCILPRFITGQLNSIAWADACREQGCRGLIASSWSRGHSNAGMNAHPEMDWYGLAAAADACWSPLDLSGLRDFDRRFAWQFFGQPDGTIGDLYFLCERTSHRVDHVWVSYLDHVAEQCAALLPQTTRNQDCMRLFAELLEVQRLRHRAQFSLLEVEYFHALWERVPAPLRKRIEATAGELPAEIDARMPALVALYAETLVAADAAELAATQLGFWRESVVALGARRANGGRTHP